MLVGPPHVCNQPVLVNSLCSPSDRPTAKSYQAPDDFNQSEWPCTLKKAVNGSRKTGQSKRKNEPRAVMLQSIEHQHGCYGDQSKRRERSHARLTINLNFTSLVEDLR